MGINMTCATFRPAETGKNMVDSSETCKSIRRAVTKRVALNIAKEGCLFHQRVKR